MQTALAPTSIECDRIALSFAIREELWILKFRSLGPVRKGFVMIMKEDNYGCTHIAENDVVHDRSKHIDIKYETIITSV